MHVIFQESLKKYNIFKAEILIQENSIVGVGSIIMPGVTLTERTSIGAISLVLCQC